MLWGPGGQSLLDSALSLLNLRRGSKMKQSRTGEASLEAPEGGLGRLTLFQTQTPARSAPKPAAPVCRAPHLPPTATPHPCHTEKSFF